MTRDGDDDQFEVVPSSVSAPAPELPLAETVTADVGSHARAASLGRVLDGYELLNPLGAGGMGIVTLARHRATGGLVAIKSLRTELARDPQAVHRFLVEARHMYRMSHPHILRVL